MDSYPGIQKFLLEDNNYQFIYDDSISIDECNKERKKKQKPEKKNKDEDE